MSKLMWIAGILLIALGLALGLMVFVSTASVIGWGITLELAAILVVGGLLNLGLGSIIETLQSRPRVIAAETSVSAVAAAAAIPEFGRRSLEPVAAVAATTAAVPGAVEFSGHTRHVHDDDVSVPTRETIEALEQARQKIERAFDPKPAAAAPAAVEPPPPTAAVEEPAAAAEEHAAEEDTPVEEDVAENEDVAEEGQLYVVEERVIRTRPARILSDGTVEAETEEGWMRFENLEHLDEYLDAMTPAKT